MTALVPRRDIERIVGVTRHDTWHWGKAVSSEQTFYILHSHACLSQHSDLRACPFSLALDRGINPADWYEDIAEPIAVRRGRLTPKNPHLEDRPEAAS